VTDFPGYSAVCFRLHFRIMVLVYTMCNGGIDFSVSSLVTDEETTMFDHWF